MMIAGIGSPDNGPISISQTLASTQPTLTAAASGGTINLSWPGGTYVLQETMDLRSGVWVDSMVPFTEVPRGATCLPRRWSIP